MRERLSDPRIEPLTSITRVKVSPDFSVAHINVSVMAAEPKRELCLKALQSAAGRLRSVVAEALTLRQAPALMFHLDDSLRRGFETVQELDRMAGQAGPDTDSEPPADSSDHPKQDPSQEST